MSCWSVWGCLARCLFAMYKGVIIHISLHPSTAAAANLFQCSPVTFTIIINIVTLTAYGLDLSYVGKHLNSSAPRSLCIKVNDDMNVRVRGPGARAPQPAEQRSWSCFVTDLQIFQQGCKSGCGPRTDKSRSGRRLPAVSPLNNRYRLLARDHLILDLVLPGVNAPS